jgi:hypothetical protein
MRLLNVLVHKNQTLIILILLLQLVHLTRKMSLNWVLFKQMYRKARKLYFSLSLAHGSFQESNGKIHMKYMWYETQVISMMSANISLLNICLETFFWHERSKTCLIKLLCVSNVHMYYIRVYCPVPVLETNLESRSDEKIEPLFSVAQWTDRIRQAVEKWVTCFRIWPTDWVLHWKKKFFFYI